MRAHATFATPDGQLHHLGHGDIIGRLWTAALSIDDARISEAHAMVSLRGDELKLLGLRGRFALSDRPLSEVLLCAGQRIALARGYAIDVVDVVLPETVTAISGPSMPGACCRASVLCSPAPVPGSTPVTVQTPSPASGPEAPPGRSR